MNKEQVKEAMLAGVLFDATDPDLTRERNACKEMCLRYNMIAPGEMDRQRELLGNILGSMGENCCIMPNFWCDYGYNIHLGDNVFINHNCVILDGGLVRFGNNVLVGPNCGFYTAGHPLDEQRRNAGLEYSHPINIGNNVWIGGGVQVMPGVCIGENSIIGGGSVVVKDIPPYVVAAGNPCRVLRNITEEDARNLHQQQTRV